MSVAAYCQQIWTRLLLKGVHYKDRHKQLDMLYRAPDPWGLDCDREKARFDATNRVILREYGIVSSVLEIGCGEGYQTQYLQKVCADLTGLDVSARAVARARARCPDAKFIVGDIRNIDATELGGRPKLVVACEVLYYVGAVQEFLNNMSALGDACLVTYHAPNRSRLEREISSGRDVQSELLRVGDTEWMINWWSNVD